MRFLVALALAACLVIPAQAEPPRPHVVFLLVDDLGWADCGFAGGTEIATPCIDRLAAAGAVLEAHYVQPVCSPTRACLLTGRHPTRTGVYHVVRPKAAWGLPLEERTLPELLREAGYATAIVGKWHLGEFDPAYLPLARGFDRQYGHFFGAIDYFTHRRDGRLDWYRDDVPLDEEGYATELLAAEACDIVARHDKRQPLFLYVPFNGVHAPPQVPDRYLTPYAGLRGPRRTLAGMLAAVDEAVGRIVAAIEAAGMTDDTLVVFSSDNGGAPPGSNGGLRDFKGSLYEGGIRGCAFATWPGRIPAGTRLAGPMHVADWFPTLASLAGAAADPTRPLDGRDVWSMLAEGKPSPHEEILVAVAPNAGALRVGDWKILSGRDAPELYDLSTDPGETNDRAGGEPERLRDMQARLQRSLAGAVRPGWETMPNDGRGRRAKVTK